METSGNTLRISRITSHSHQEIWICYLIFSVTFPNVKLMDILWFSYLVLKILCGVWFCFSYSKHQDFPLDVDRRDWVIFLLNGFCWQDGFRLLTKHPLWAWWPKALMECVLWAGQIEMVVTKMQTPQSIPLIKHFYREIKSIQLTKPFLFETEKHLSEGKE